MTSAQLTTLKADILADPALSAQPNTPDGNFAIAQAYAVIVSPDFFVYRTDIPVREIFDQIQWAKLTPADVPDTTQAWANRSLACQGKQFNVQILLQGQPIVDASKSNIRAGLQDALTNVPSGVSGATQAAGWVGVRDNALARRATRSEQLFASTASGNGSTAALAATLVVEGALTPDDIQAARQS